ncbi:myogenesis-regulating glycosidase-like [Mercenaria mercenaria]|uniref:myogenesis-regulating glycosidase-like n=1 Tax=Mercenaria mercenaria TaxID=6596 RepID=UPI00234F31ED|nr:myogenesis-regulating glycosidase-like [Mercenaria mercenaria]
MDCEAPQKRELKREKEHEKLLSHTDPVKGVHYGNLDGASAVAQSGSVSSLGTKSLSQETSKEKYLKSLAEEEAPQSSCKKKVLKVVVTFLFIVIVVGIVIIWSFHEGRSRKNIGNHYFDFVSKQRVLNVYNVKDDIVLSGFMKTSQLDIGKVHKCDEYQTDDVFCFRFGDETVFRFFPYTLKNAQVHCNDIVWTNMKSNLHIPVDCYDIEFGLWYGLPNFNGSFWPVKGNKVSIDKLTYQPYGKSVLGQVLENYWLNAEGSAIIVHQPYPIKFSFNAQNDKKLCFSLDYENLKQTAIPTINYTICQGPDIKTTFLATRNHFFPLSEVVKIAEHDFSKILWKFENRYKNNHQNFGEFLHKLNTLGLPINMIEYDTDWQENVGDFKFTEKVANELSLYLNMNKGKYSNTKLMLPLTLACSYKAEENFKMGADKDLFVKDIYTHGFKMISYKEQSCALWDATYVETKDFLKEKLDSLQQKGTVEETLYPQAFEVKTTIANAAIHHTLFRNTSDINAMNSEFAAILLSANKSVLIETAYHMQNMTIFVEIPTLVANKSGKKCLDYIVSGALTAGIHGYPYVITLAPPEDMIDTELLIRWIEVAVYFPGLQVTNAVLNFGDRPISLLKNMSLLRESVVIPAYSDIVSETKEGIPLLRPLWWVDPLDFKTLRISDQFLIGETIMVAPVLCLGDRKRDIYLPTGQWIHSKTGKTYAGKQWLKDFIVQLEDIAVFYLHQDTTQNSTVSSITP